jgi:hypothetical protein
MTGEFRMQGEHKIIFQSETGPRALRAQRGADAEFATAELAGGAEGLVLTTAASVQALRDLPLHSFSIRNEAGDTGARTLVELIARQPIDPARLDISFGVSDTSLADELAALGFMGPFFEVHAQDLGECG